MTKFVPFALCVLSVGFLAGCASPKSAQVQPGPQPAASANVPTTPEPTGKVTDKDLANDKTAYEKEKAAYAKDPSHKKAYVEATNKYATDMMASDLQPHEKYPGALRLYRETLKVDPNNADAQNYKNLIETIYKQMGRPIPQ